MINIIEGIPIRVQEGTTVTLDIEMFGQDKDRLHRPHGTFACMSIKVGGIDEVYQIYDVADIPKVFKAVKEGTWILQNALYDLRQLRAIDTSRFLYTDRDIWDTMLVEQNLFGGYYRGVSLADLARRYLDILVDKSERNEFETATSMTDAMKQYAADDVILTEKVYHKQRELGRDMSNYWKCDAPMIWVVLDMLPVKVDVELWKEVIEGFALKAKELETGLGFNVKSVPQVLKALEAQGIRVKSTGKDVLESHRKNDVVAGILETRKYRTACSNYGLNWLDNSVEDGDLIHANWNITGASTGRMSCTKPPLQTVPRKDFPIYREFFIPQHDILLAPDVSQQEPRILGYLSQDKNLLAALSSGESVHVYVARMIYDDPTIVKDGTDIRYAVGKAINLAIGYGLSAVGLAEQTGLSEDEAQKIIDKYFLRFPNVKYYMQKYRNMAYRDHYVTTVAGRRMYVNPYDFKSENNAINSPIQGGAADFTKVWAITVRQLCKQEEIPFSLCMAIHDELVFDAQNQYKEQTIRIIGEAMVIAGLLYPGIPFTSDMNEGRDWSCHS